jgi:uncharacterized protein (DUF488 family)
MRYLVRAVAVRGRVREAVMSALIFTIGHSIHLIERFVALLAQHGVTALADVRSAPYSRIAPQFRRDALAASMQAHGIAYVFLGRELGARRDEPEVYDGDIARYERIARTEAFTRGMQRVEQGASKFRVALMCAEKDPITCHRALLVSRQLSLRGHAIEHIREDGTTESTAAFDERLLAATGVAGADLFRSRAELIADAYAIQGERMAYRRAQGGRRVDDVSGSE